MTFLNGYEMMAIFYHWQKSSINTIKYQICLHFSFSFVFRATRQKQLYHLLLLFYLNLSECSMVFSLEWTIQNKSKNEKPQIFFSLQHKNKNHSNIVSHSNYFHTKLYVLWLPFHIFFSSLYTFVHKVIRNFQNIFSSIKLFSREK